MAVGEEEIFSAEYLHEKLEIPRRYLRTMLTDLSRLGFIKSAKGRKGGFIFARPIGEISLSNIIEMVEGTPVSGNCLLGHTKCREDQRCVMHETWMEARSSMIKTLSQTTLQDIKERKRAVQGTD